ncbi:extracellular solute-binding protein [Paenibacillus sp. UNCCL117]|uniref:ABC transporter substrate-binding protein n=1 Tax=unclassified Paenibacillus TaxID=185978 RepID=UPI00087E1991|nr:MULTISPECIES: ABC transporter substrate-binding protein [unclassified Paenibacillus]SDE07609.1 extracellular solute-binding protein [Paenibacillus sp. cl123]SFW59138.1 extracellular solute-binding protein [Paenibacillus sp. UNCCL117]
MRRTDRKEEAQAFRRTDEGPVRPADEEKAPEWESRLARLPLGRQGFSEQTITRIEARLRRPTVRTRRSKLFGVSAAALLLGTTAVFGILQSDRMTAGIPWLSKPLQEAPPPLDAGRAYKLRVSVDDETGFMARYGTAFQQKFPNVQLELIRVGDVPLTGSVMRSEVGRWPRGEELPDVMALRADEFAQLAGQGRLYALDAAIRQDGFPIERMHAGLVDALRSQGEGRLYGLTPGFRQTAIYYNKSLFDRYGVEYPKEGLTWPELLQLAVRVGEQGGKREGVFGLAASTPAAAAEWTIQAAAAMGLTVVDPSAGRVNLDVPRWKEAWGAVLEAVRQGHLQAPAQESEGKGKPAGASSAEGDLFAAGKAAMTLQTYSYAMKLSVLSSRLDWDLVREPGGLDRPGESSSFSIGRIYAVSASSSSQRAAWELVRFIQEREGELPAAAGSDYSPAMPVGGIPGKGMEALLELRPPSALFASGGGQTYSDFVHADFSRLLWRKSAEILAGQRTLDQALPELQSEAQALLEQRTKAQGQP